MSSAWCAFLSRWEWEWFCSFTFREETHPESADKRFRVWISKANRELYGVRWYRRTDGIRWVRALEMQRRGVIHYHGLLAGIQDLRRLTWMDRWNELAGFARITPILSAEAVLRYVAKYCVKGGEIDLCKGMPPLPLLGCLAPVALGVTPGGADHRGDLGRLSE